jgi:uncharacterized membrane protein YeiH
MSIHYLIGFFDSIGIMAFAATGALVAGQRKMDIFGGLVLAIVTGIGGGTVRDLILDLPVFWITDNDPLWACLVGFGVALLLLYRGHSVLPSQTNRVMQGLDALGLALFTVIGAHKAITVAETNSIVAVIMGVLTGIGGGLLRDVLANKIPLVLSRIRFYATASVLGAVVFAVLWHYQPVVALVAGFAVTLFCRIGALIYDWRLPMFPKHKEIDPA